MILEDHDLAHIFNSMIRRVVLCETCKAMKSILPHEGDRATFISMESCSNCHSYTAGVLMMNVLARTAGSSAPEPGRKACLRCGTISQIQNQSNCYNCGYGWTQSGDAPQISELRAQMSQMEMKIDTLNSELHGVLELRNRMNGVIRDFVEFHKFVGKLPYAFRGDFGPAPELMYGLTIPAYEALKSGKVIEAIKITRATMDPPMGLKEAKDLVDAARDKMAALKPAYV